MTLVFEKKANGPATHVIVVGVGDYSYLPGEQLTSPPHSARAFADWFLRKHRNPRKKLASLELLVSDAEIMGFKLPDGKTVQIERANMANTKKAMRAWIDRGNESPDNQMIFHFCGHGIATSLITVLLLDDFGERRDAMFENAIDFRGFYNGMERECKAREQCFFVDACRQISETLIASDYHGDPIVHGSARLSQFGTRHAPIYYSTVAGGGAYGQRGAPSVFTAALLRAMGGAGSSDFEGDWRIYTNRLNIGIEFLLKWIMDDSIKLLQLAIVDHLDGFPLHYLDQKPLVPVTIHCEPSAANEEAELSFSYYDGSGKVARPCAQSSDWDVDLEPGRYIFSARFPKGNYRDNAVRDKYVQPAGHIIPIEVRK